MTAPHAFQRRGFFTCLTCDYAKVRSRDELPECTRNHIRIRWDIITFGCGDYAARDEPVAVQTRMTQFYGTPSRMGVDG